ncbi:MAG: ABC transporter ATP-binding protein [Candidatus Bathyarchaeia archaeon]
MVLLDLEGITKRFGGVTALQNVTLQVNKNEILGLIGPNGSGKTTLINVISGVYKPDAGRIKYKDMDITTVPPHLRCRMGIARTYQVTRPFSNLKVLENVVISVLNGKRCGKVSVSEAEKIAENILETLGLSKMKELPARSLNAQGRKKMEIARAIGVDPELLLLDECLAGLAPSEIAEMLKIIQEIKNERNMTIIMIEHLMHAVMNISDRVAVLHEGRLIAEGKPEEIAKDVNVAEVYFGDRELALKLVKR